MCIYIYTLYVACNKSFTLTKDAVTVADYGAIVADYKIVDINSRPVLTVNNRNNIKKKFVSIR